jgi:hypothetical protein
MSNILPAIRPSGHINRQIPDQTFITGSKMVKTHPFGDGQVASPGFSAKG